MVDQTWGACSRTWTENVIVLFHNKLLEGGLLEDLEENLIVIMSIKKIEAWSRSAYNVKKNVYAYSANL